MRKFESLVISGAEGALWCWGRGWGECVTRPNLHIRRLVCRSTIGLDPFADWSCRVCRLGARMSPQIRLLIVVKFANLIEISRRPMSAPTTTDTARARAEHTAACSTHRLRNE